MWKDFKSFAHYDRNEKDEDGNRVWRMLDSTQYKELEHLPSGRLVRVIASDPETAHGLRPQLVVGDEPSKWKKSKTDELYGALTTSLGKVPGSRFIAIGTRPSDNDHWFERLLQDADFALCHCAEPEDDAFSPKTWAKAIPQLNRLPDLRRAIAALAKKAQRDTLALAQLRANYLNMGVADTLVLYLVSPEEWVAAEGNAAATGPCLWGIDLGATAAMSAVTAYLPETGRLDSVAAFPSNPPLKERERQDGVKPGLYQRMHDRNELLLLGDKVVPVAELLNAAQERLGYPDAIA